MNTRSTITVGVFRVTSPAANNVRVLANSSTKKGGNIFILGNDGKAVQNASPNSLSFSNATAARAFTNYFFAQGLDIEITGSGDVIFDSIIAGTNGFDKTGTGGGALILRKANTFLGDMVISNGAVKLQSSCALVCSNIVISGNATCDVSGLTTALTLPAGQGLKANGSSGTVYTASGKGLTTATATPITFMAYNGKTAPLRVDGAGSLTLAAGNCVTVTVANSGKPLASATRTYKLIATNGTATVAGTAPSTVVVNGDGASGTASLEIYNNELYLNIAGCSPGEVVHVQQTNYYTKFTDGGDIFNQGTTEVGMWANTGNKKVVAWRNFKTDGSGGGANRELQVGDRFRISVYGYSPYGILGCALLDSPSSTSSWNDRTNTTRGYIECGNSYGDLYVTYGSGSTASWSGIKPWGTTVTLEYHILSTREFTANIVGQTAKYDLSMMNNPGDSDLISGYSIYYWDDWNGSTNQNAYWKQETAVTNLGYVEFGADNGTRTIAGKITDGNNPACTNTPSPNYLKKSGSGIVSLGNTANTYTLDTRIDGGTLAIGADTALGTAPGAVSNAHIKMNAAGAALVATNTFTLSANRGITLANWAYFGVADGKTVTYNGVITDGGSSYQIVKNQGGTLILGGANSYDNGTYIDNGTLTLNNAAAAGTGGIYIGQDTGSYSATLNIASAITVANNITVRTETSGIKYITATETATLSGTVAINEQTDDLFNIDVASGKTLTMSGVMSGDSGGGEITKTGDGTLVISNSGNTHDKKVTVNAGTLSISASRNLGADPAGPYTNKLTLNGGTLKATASFTMHANNSTTLGASHGTIEVGSGLTLTYPAAISGSGNLTKTGDGTLTLSGDNTFTGSSAINAGTAIVTSWTDDSAFTVASGATLMGDGAVDALTANGKVDPGNSAATVGSLGCDNALVLNGGGSMQVDITNVTGTAGVNWDVINSGAVTCPGSGTFTIYLNDVGTIGFNSSVNYSWKIVDGSSVAGYAVTDFTVDTTQFSPSLDGGTFSVTNSGGDLYLSFAAPVAPPEISVRGTNMAEIASGDYTVAVADGTDFQSVTAGGSHDHIFTITNAGGAVLTLSGQPTLSGSSAFTIQSGVADLTLDAGQDETFTIRFAPTDAGLTYTSMVTIVSDDSNEGTYTFAISGVSPCFTNITGMYVNPTNVTDFTLNWTAVSSADAYLVDVSTSQTFTTAAYVSGYSNRWVGGATTSLSVTGLATNVTYYYRMTVTNENCAADSSVTGTVTTILPPDQLGPTISNFGVTNKTGTTVLDRDWSSFPIYVNLYDATSGISWASAPAWALTNGAVNGSGTFTSTGHSTGETNTTATGTVSGISFAAGTWTATIWASDKGGYSSTQSFTFTAADDDSAAPTLGGASDDWQVFYNLPDQNSSSPATGEFVVRTQLIYRLNQLQSGDTATLATYTFSGDTDANGFAGPLMNAMSNALARGATVRFIGDSEVDTNAIIGTYALADLGRRPTNPLLISIDDSAAGIMHHKLGLFDYGAGERYVMAGSHNFTAGAATFQWNIMTEIRSDDLYALYDAEADELMAGRFHDDPSKVHCDGTFSMQGSWGENRVRFSPYPDETVGGDNAQTDITNLIANAQSDIFFAINLFTRPLIASQLVAAVNADQTLNVHGVFPLSAINYYADMKTIYSYLTNSASYSGTNRVNMHLAYEDAAHTSLDDGSEIDLVHAKYMLIDPFSSQPVVIQGSANWTAAALVYDDTNDENIQFLRHAGIASYYFEQWTKMTGLFTNLVSLSNAGAAMKVYAGSTLASIAGGAGTNLMWEIEDSNLLTNTLSLVFNVYDDPSGINRGVNSSATNMHVSVANLCTNNVTNYVAALSSAQTTNSSSTSVWKFVSFPADLVDAMIGTNAVYITVPDADSDRAGDSSTMSYQLVGYIVVVPSCPTAPTTLYASQTNATDFTATWGGATYADGYLLDVATNSSFSAASGATLKFQGFEGTGSDNWTFVTNAGSVSTVTTTSRTGSASLQFTGTGDVTFAATACSPGATVIVAYACSGLDSGEDLLMDVLTSAGGTTTSNRVKLIDGYSNAGIDFGETSATNPGTMASNPYALALGSVTQVIVRFYGKANGSEYFYVDDIELRSGGSSAYVPGYNGREVSGTSQLVTGLTESITYYFRVKATNNYCSSDWSVITQVVTVVSQDTAGPTFSNFAVTNSTGTTVLDRDFVGFPLFVNISDSTTGVRWTTAEQPFFTVTNPSGSQVVGPTNFLTTGHVDREKVCTATGMVPNIASSFVAGTWKVGVWAEDMNNYAGASNFTFTAADDDTTAPVVQSLTLYSADGISTVSVAALLGGYGWNITGRVNDADSGIDTNGFLPYFLLVDYDGTVRYSNTLVCGFADGGATLGGNVSNAVLSALASASTGIWTAKLFIADNDADGWTGDGLVVTGETAFTVIAGCPSIPSGLYANPTNTFDFTANWAVAGGADGYLINVYSNYGMASDLIISEYVEGSGNNKFIEIYNGTGSSVDLTNYVVLGFFNGASAPTYSMTLSGTLAHDSVFVIENSSEGLGVAADLSTNSNVMTFNGDDAIALSNTATRAYCDIIGQIGTDPGTEWGTGDASTADNTIRKKSAVVIGDTVGTDAFDPATDWDGYAVDTVAGLGSHTVSGLGTVEAIPGYSNRVVAAGTSQSVTGLVPNTEYYFQIASTSAGCTSLFSSIATVLTRPVPNLTAASATADGKTLVDLAWTKHASYDVMIVHKADSASTAPTQGSAYSVGSACGGGTVIYKGSGSALEHVVPSDETHYYAFYSYSGNYYSTGLTASATMEAFASGEIVDTFSYTNGTTLAACAGSNGWSSTAWSDNTSDFSVSSGSFSAQGTYQTPTGNKILVSPAENTTKYVTRSVPNWFSSVVYASYIVNFQYGGASKWCGAYLMDGTTPRVFFGEGGGGDQVLAVHNTTSSKAMTAGSGNDYIVVVKYDIANDNAYASVYKIGTDIFPYTEPGSWDAEYLNVNPSGGGYWINGIRLEAGGTGAGVTPGNVYYDEVRMASSWSELVALMPGFIYDGFGGTVGNSLSGWYGGTGWGDTWTLGGTPSANFSSGSFDTGNSSYFTPTGQKIVLYGDVDDQDVTATRTFDTTFTTGQVYFSWIQNYEFNGSGKWAGLSLLESGTEKAFVGKVSGADKSLGIDSSSANATSGINLENGTGNDYIIVAKYDFTTRELCATSYKIGSGTNVEMIAEEPNGYWQVVSTQTVGHISSLTGVRLNIGANSGLQIGDVYMDEVRVGTNWFMVTRRDGETNAAVMAAGPVPALIYVGTDTFANAATYLAGTVADITVTDQALSQTNKPLTIAARWTDPNGVWLTNANSAIVNIGSRNGRVNPNWDPAVLEGQALAAVGYDARFTNFWGANGGLCVTTFVDHAFNITNDYSSFTSVYYMTMSAEDNNTNGGMLAAPNGGDAVPVWRAITVNSNVRFYVSDDDTNAPVVSSVGVHSASGVGTVHVDNVTAGGFAWCITGLVYDADSGINVNGSSVTMPDISPYVIVYDSTGQARFTNVLNRAFLDGGAKVAADGSVSNSSLAAVASPPMGVWSAVVVAADNDFDRTGDAKYHTNSCTFKVIACPTAPTGLFVNPTNWFDFTLNWTTQAWAEGYVVDVSTTNDFDIENFVDDFTDNDFTANPDWGNDNDWSVLTDSTLSNGLAATDGHYLGSDESVANATLTLPSTETNEWRFSLGTPDFDPASASYIAVVLMASDDFAGDMVAANFQGYYLKLGVDGATDYIELHRKTGAGTVKIGDFSGAGNYASGGLEDGLNIRVTRSSAGVFELFYSTGFTYDSVPTTSGGTLSDSTYTTSAYFGVHIHTAYPSVDRRIYFDNFAVGPRTSYVNHYEDRPASGSSLSVTGLNELTTYYFRVGATNNWCETAYSITGSVTTIAQPDPPKMTNFGINALSDTNATDGELATSFNVLSYITDTNGGLDWVIAPTFAITNPSGTAAASGSFLQGSYTQGVTSVIATGTVAAGVAYANMELGNWTAGLWARDTNGYYRTTNYSFTVTDDDTTGPTISNFYLGSSVMSSSASGTVNTNLIGFNFEGYLGTEGQGTSTYAAANMQSPAYITRGAGIGPTRNANSFRATNWAGTADADAALAANKYFEWTVQPQSGYAMSITGITVKFDRSATGPSNFVLRASHDGYSADLVRSTNFGATLSLTSNLLYVADLQNVSGPITFRLIAWGTANNAGTLGIESSTTGDYELLLQGMVAGIGSPAIVGTNTDHQIRYGGYGVTVTVQDATSGLLSSNAASTYYVLYNTNGTMMSSNVFPTPFVNGSTAAETLSTTGGPSVSAEVVMLGVCTAFVYGVDADNDRAGDFASTLSDAMTFLVIDDDTNPPTSSSFQISGSGTEWDSMTGILTVTGIVSDASGVDADNMYYLMVSNDANKGVIWSNSFTATQIGSTTNWAVTSTSTGPDIEGCGGEFYIRVFAIDGDLDRGTVDTLSSTNETLLITVIGTTTDSTYYATATNLYVKNTKIVDSSSLTMLDSEINTGGYNLSLTLAHDAGIYTNSSSPSFSISNSLGTIIRQPLSNIAVVVGTPDYYIATNYSLPAVSAANVATGWYSVYWSASNGGSCVASAVDRGWIGGTNVFLVNDDDSAAPTVSMYVMGQAYAVCTVEVADADAGFSFTGLVRDAASGIDINNNPPLFDIYNESGTLIFDNQKFTTQPAHGGALSSAEPLAVTITNLAGATCGNIYTVKVSVVDNDGDRTGDSLTAMATYVIQVAGAGDPPDATNLTVNSTPVTAPGAVTVYDGAFSTGAWSMSMEVSDTNLIVTGPDAPRYLVKDPANADMYGGAHYWSNCTKVASSVLVSNSVMPTPQDIYFTLGTYKVFWSGKTEGLCYGESENTYDFGAGYTNVFTLADDDTVKPMIVDNFSVAGGTVTGGVGFAGCDDSRTNLVAGDIAIIGMNTMTQGSPITNQQDSFAFVATVGIPAGTVIHFTDNGWRCGSLNDTEGYVTWTATDCVAPGTVVIIKKWADPTDPASGISVNYGSVVDPFGFNSGLLVNRQREQILAYQGTASDPTFLYCLNSASGVPGTWSNCPPPSTERSYWTALPPGLQDGLTAVSVANYDDVVLSTNVLSIDGDRQAVLEYIGNYSNWIGHDEIVYPLNTWNFTFPSLGSVGGTVTDEDILLGNWDVTGQVYDVHSGLSTDTVYYSAFNTNGVKFIDSAFFTNIWPNASTQMVNLSVTAVQPANSYTNVTLGTGNLFRIYATDADNDRYNDSLSTNLNVYFTVVDDDINPPFFDSLTWNGLTYLSTGVTAVAVTARVNDIESGIAFVSATPYILVLDSSGAPVVSNSFTIGSLTNGAARNEPVAITAALDLSDLACGTFTARVVLTDADLDRLDDSLVVTNIVTLDMAGSGTATPATGVVTAAGIELEAVAGEITDGMINTGGWDMAAALYHASGIAASPYYQVFSAATNELFSGVWSNYTTVGTDFFGTNPVSAITDAGIISLIDTGLYPVVWYARSDNECDLLGAFNTNHMLVVDDDTNAPAGWETPTISVTYDGAWTNVNDFTATWTASSDDSGFSFMRVINTNPLNSLTMGIDLGTNNTLHITDAVEGQTTNWIYAVDYDKDRPDDQIRTMNTNFVIRLDMTPPDLPTVFQPSAGADASSEIKWSWEALPDGGGANLSPWESYRVYYEVDNNNVTTNSPYFDHVEYSVLGTNTTTEVTLSNLAFGSTYYLKLAGVDKAGNIGPLAGPYSWSTIAFNLTQAVTRVNGQSKTNEVLLSWTPVMDELGEFPRYPQGRAVDIIYVDSASFVDTLTNQWALWQTETEDFWLLATNLNIPATKTRFFRAAIGKSWETNRTPRAASKEVWGLRPVNLYTGQNWVALFGRPYSNTVIDVIGNHLPGNTKISWYARTAGTPTNWWVSTQQVMLVSDTVPYWVVTVPTNSTLNGDTVPLPLHEAFVIEIPTNSTMQTIYLVGQVPTNTLYQQIYGLKARNMVSMNLPYAMHPSQMGLTNNGGQFKGGLTPVASDQIWKYDRAQQKAPYAVWLRTSDNTWRLTSSGFPAVPAGYFSSDDGIFIYSQTNQLSSYWIHPPLPYTPPTTRITP